MTPAISPIYILRAYIWDVLKANTTMDEGDYGGLIPIVPLGEEPELAQYSGPHIVYGFVLNPTNDLYAERDGSMSMIIYSQNFATINKIIAILEEAFGRWDEAARSVNKYSEQIPEFLGIRFGYISLGYAEGASAEEEEGGRQTGLINIRFCFFADYDVNVDPPVTFTV